MQIEVEIWSDNHSKDELFGTKPNQPHRICKALTIGGDLIEATFQAVRSILLPDNPDERINVVGSGKDPLGRSVLRMRIAESEFVCAAKAIL